jgi:hypothetical protein
VLFFTIASLIARRHGTGSSRSGGDGLLAAGLHLLAWTASVTVVAPLVGRLANRVNARPLAALGLTLQAAGMGWLALSATPSLP